MKSQTSSLKCKPSLILSRLTNFSEALIDDPDFPEKQLAASVTSKVFYYLEAYEDSLQFALDAGDYFDIRSSQKSKYVDTLLHCCVDSYIEQRQAVHDKKDPEAQVNPKMEAVVDKLFERCFEDGQYGQAIGLALESRRLDKLRESIEKSGKLEEKLAESFELA